MSKDDIVVAQNKLDYRMTLSLQISGTTQVSMCNSTRRAADFILNQTTTATQGYREYGMRKSEDGERTSATAVTLPPPQTFMTTHLYFFKAGCRRLSMSP
jgi:hypothetical protein